MSSAQLKKFLSVKQADIEWRDDLPFSREFNDVYYSIHGAIEESKHVFLEGNRLANDWKNKSEQQFSIAELGFGSGLNFLNTASLWAQHQSEPEPGSENKQQLHYLAIEKRPFSIEDFKRSSANWPELAEFSETLVEHYPAPTYGRHQIYFKKWQLTLTLMLMPLDNALDDLIEESSYSENGMYFDYWYLDGFAPTKNADMWGLENAKKIALLSKLGTRLSTYSVAGTVKRSLAEVGFKLTKRKGFAKKREMLTAEFTEQNPETVNSKYINLKFETPWFKFSGYQTPAGNNTKKIAIIGAGIAGCTTAFTLTQQGFNCDLFEENITIVAGASGAAAGIFHPQLTSDMNIGSQYNWQAYLVLLDFIGQLSEQEKDQIILSQGIERFLKTAKIANDLAKLSKQLGIDHWISRSQKFTDNDRCLSFPHAAAINLAAFCHLLIDKIPRSQFNAQLNTEVKSLQYVNGGWNLCCHNKKTDEVQSIQYAHVIFCGGAKSKLLESLDISRENISRGQSCFFQSQKLADSIDQTLMESVYLVPQKQNTFQLGTTFDNFEDDQVNPTSQIDMLNRAATFLNELSLPSLAKQEIEKIPLNGTVGYRLHTKDRMPLVGPAPDNDKLESDFNNLGQSRITREEISYYNRPGLWINTAYGSHGLLFSLLASQHISNIIQNKPSPLSCALMKAIHPSRFKITALKRKY